MRKRKATKPTSIRLSPERELVVQDWARTTGWSVSKCLGFAVGTAICAHTADKATLAKLMHEFRIACKLKQLQNETAAKAKAIRAGEGGAR